MSRIKITNWAVWLWMQNELLDSIHVNYFAV